MPTATINGIAINYELHGDQGEPLVRMTSTRPVFAEEGTEN